MKLGYFTMPVHPPARSYVETLKEDREAFILADRLGYSEGYCGEHLTDLAENIPSEPDVLRLAPRASPRRSSSAPR